MIKGNGLKVSELTGAQLDYWAAKASGLRNPRINTRTGYAPIPGDEPYCMYGDRFGFMPSTEWRDGGPIIERDGIQTLRRIETPSPVWDASLARGACALEWFAGPTPLIAAMRAYVASKYGEEVPDEVQSDIKST